MRRKERARLKDFEKDGRGGYVYRGVCYGWSGCGGSGRSGEGVSGEGRTRPAQLIRLWAVCGGMLLSLGAAGFVDGPGTGSCVYVILPYVSGLLGGVSACWGLGRLTAGGDPVRDYVLAASAGKIPERAVFTAVGADMAMAGELICVLRHGLEGKPEGFVLFLLLEGIGAALALLLRKQVCAMEFSPRQAEEQANGQVKNSAR